MKPVVGVIDYGMGNLHSVGKAFTAQNARVIISNTPRLLKKVDLLVLPGVGSFGAAMKNLAKNGLDDFVVQWIADKKPYLGICLGFQLLFERSEESPGVAGLGVFGGRVVRFRSLKNGKRLVVPHMGWNTLNVKKKFRNNIFAGVKKGDRFYFVHSFYPVPKKQAIVATTTPYGGGFCSSVGQDRLFASQFHPEKSGRLGSKIISNILKNLRRGGKN
jgi:glutamine amidotransferase